MVAKYIYIYHYTFCIFFVLPDSFSVVWHVSNKQRMNITIKKRVGVFFYFIFYQSEASFLFWVKKAELKPSHSSAFFHLHAMFARKFVSFRKSFTQVYYLHIIIIIKFRDSSIFNVSVQRDSPTTICRYWGCRLLSWSVGTFSLRLGRNVERLTSLRICTPRSFFSLSGSLPCPYLVIKTTCCSVSMETVESCFTNECFPGRSSRERSGEELSVGYGNCFVSQTFCRSLFWYPAYILNI